MKACWLAPIVVLVGACGTQELRFEPDDAGAGADGRADAGADTEAGAASGCMVDSDCPLTDLHCDTSSGRCVACLKNDQCHDLNFGVCSAEHQCVQCNVDGDCQGGRCEPTTHRCIPSCADGGASACPSTLWMCIRSGDCVECLSDPYCSSNRTFIHCDPAVGQCVQCIDDGDCGGTRPRCDRPAGRCVQCLSSSGCEPGEACDPENHTCVAIGGVPFGDGGVAPALHDGGVGVGYDARP